MSFSISFLDEPVFYDEDTPMATGELVLGEYRETFCASLFQWNKSDYEAQWRDAIKSLLEGSRSALMVHYVNQEFADNFEWWPMYKEGDIVYFQNQLPWHDQMPQPLSLDDIPATVRNRITVNEDGIRLSEWTVKLSDIEDFARTQHI